MAVYRYSSTTGKILKSQRPAGRWKWRYKFQINGQRYSGICHGAQTKKQAEEIEAEMQRLVMLGTYGKQAAKPANVPTLVEYGRGPYLRWAKTSKRTWRWDELQIERFDAYPIGKKPLNEIERADVNEYIQTRLEEITERGTLRSKTSVNRERALLCTICNHAIDNGRLEKNPCDRTRIKKAKGKARRSLSRKEQQVLLDALTGDDAWLLPIVRVALGTGMRRGELLKLRVEHLNFDDDMINLPAEITKADVAREIPMNDDVRSILIELRGKKTQGKIFNVKPSRVTQRFGAICDKLGFGDIVFHCLRHTAATRMTESGVSPFVIQKVVGHASLGQTADYTDVSKTEKRKAVKTLQSETGRLASVQAESEEKKNDALNMSDNSRLDDNLQA
jgi:integrase